MMSSRARGALVTVFTTILTVIATACAGSESDGSGGGSTTTTSTTTSTSTSVGGSGGGGGGAGPGCPVDPEIVDTGDIALNGSTPSSGSNLTTGGWLANGGTGEANSYSNAEAHDGVLSLRTSGHNASGVHAPAGGSFTTVAVDGWYLSDSSAGADQMILAATNGSVEIMTEGFCGGTSSFMYGYSEPGGSQLYVPIPGAPTYTSNQWYHFQIMVDGTQVTTSVGDGVTTGVATFSLSTALAFGEFRLTTDCCGGCDHAAYWDGLSLDGC